MRYIADFHLHSKYSRATSRQMDLEHLDQWARIKGIQILGTGDFTHPLWFNELKEKLTPIANGIYQLKSLQPATRFILTTEISCIYSKNNKVRRIHLVVFAPNLETAERINQKLGEKYNLRSDGRPILGLDAKELTKILLDISSDCLIVPAHAWTPWYSIFGSKSGFNSVEECFEEMTPHIYALETGLSSDPPMNWRWSYLDKYTLISNSDAHSPENLGREANVFEFAKDPNYSDIIGAIKDNALIQSQSAPASPTSPASPSGGPSGRSSPRKSLSKNISVNQRSNLPKSAFIGTIEFFPEEGKYHFDGHRECGVRFSPAETKKQKGICPKCHRPLTIGVMYRVEELADRSESRKPIGAPDFKSLIPLKEILSEVFGQSKISKIVEIEYQNLIKKGGSEFNILIDLSEEELSKITQAKIVEAILKMRRGEVFRQPGYDGVYGQIKIFQSSTNYESKYKYTNKQSKKSRQASLF